MAIWPFGRKAKRHTIQLDTAVEGDVAFSQGPRHSLDEGKLGRRPSRKHSKRQKNRYSQPVDGYPTHFQDGSPPSSQPTQHAPSTSQSEQVRSVKDAALRSSTTINQENNLLFRHPSLRKLKRNENPAVLKKRLSKRKAYEIAREREIRLMASSPIDIPRRTITPFLGDHVSIEERRIRNRLLDRHQSELSLSIHDSAASSLSDLAESYKFKVNSFSAWTPRPVIRYVEAPRVASPRSQKSPEPLDRRAKTPALAPSNENLQSRKRIDKLADDLDAAALRELMERDRRRRERKQIEDQEKLQRKLQRNARRQRLNTEVNDSPLGREAEKENLVESPRSCPPAEREAESQPTNQNDEEAQETDAFLVENPTGSWLGESSKEPEQNGRESPDSVRVIGNLEESSVREQRFGQRLSFGPSQDMGMSRSTLSPSHSPTRHRLGSPNSSQLYSVTRESASDMSRTIDSERRLSDHSAGRVNTISSLFRRGSSRLKRRYRERFPDRPPLEVSNVSHESFFKVHTQASVPATYVPPKALLGSNAFKRSQSKFTEHLGEEPLSPPDSRLQSPEIAEEHVGQTLEDTKVPDLQTRSQYPIPGTDIPDLHKNRHHSWAGDSLEDDPDNLPLSQSLASVDSEGSWMSGQFLRRISQKPSNLTRPSMSSTRNKMDEGQEKPFSCDEVPGEEEFVNFGTFPDEISGDSSNPTEDQDKDLDVVHPSEPAQETWHRDIAKRPVLVNPTIRPRSNEGLLNSVRSLSPISAEVEFSTIEGYSPEILETVHEHDSSRT